MSRAPKSAAFPQYAEFVALIASLMAMTALSIDLVLPALPAVARELMVVRANDRQWMIGAFMLAFGIMQLIYGPLSDRFGRRPVLIAGLVVGLLCNLAAAAADSFALLLAARAASGGAVAAARVVGIAIVRDRFEGRAMASVMSLSMSMLMVVPVLAPSIGQLILIFAHWRALFLIMAAVGLVLTLWTYARLPETQPAASRVPLGWQELGRTVRTIVADRQALGYILASAALQGSMFGYLNSVQQIFAVTFHRPAAFASGFAISAATVAIVSIANSRLVLRFGARALSHRALIVMIGLALVHFAIARAGRETVTSFVILQSAAMACTALIGSNFSSIAMHNVGRIAGSVSSFQGCVQTTIGAGIGIGIGQAFDGTSMPLFGGIFACASLSLTIVLLVERGRLFDEGRPAGLAPETNLDLI